MRTPFAVSVILAILLSLPAGAVPPDPPPGDIHLALDLADGSLLTGMGPDAPLTLHSRWGRLLLRLADLTAIVFHPDLETATVTMRNGDTVRGVVEPSSFAVRGPGGEERRVTGPELRELRVTPPLCIAGSADAAWEVSFERVRGWTVQNPRGGLVVTDMKPVTFSSASRGTWSHVRIGREVPPLGDLDLSADISWGDQGAGRRAMHWITVVLVDDCRNVIAAVGHRDAWVNATGARLSQLPGVKNIGDTHEGSEPAAGRARLGISRVGRHLLVSWDGVVMQEGESPARVSRVEVHFAFYDYRGRDGPSKFGVVTLDRLELRPLPPAPPAGVFRHAVDGEVRGLLEFLPGGRLGPRAGEDRWTLHGSELVLTWPRSDAPGGAWVDRLRLSSGGSFYSGGNQAGMRISGERVERADPATRLAPDTPHWPLDLLPEQLSAPAGRLSRLLETEGGRTVHYLVNRTAAEVVVPQDDGAPDRNPGAVLRLPPERFVAWFEGH